MGAEGALCGRGWDQPRRPSCLGWQASERAPKIDHRSPLHSNLVTSRTIPESSRRARVGCANRRALRRCDATSEAPGDLPATAPVFTFIPRHRGFRCMNIDPNTVELFRYVLVSTVYYG
jgi:hypothetical protein